MTRISKQAEGRARFPRRRKAPSSKTGPKKDNIPGGFRSHANALEGDLSGYAFIPKIS